MDREIGFYWVQTCDAPDTWAVAEWNGERFLMPGSTYGYIPEEMIEFGPRVLAPTI